MSDCIFCKIVSGEVPSTVVYEDDHCVAFNDINPVAPVHVLLVPREHVPSIRHLKPEHAPMIAGLTLGISRVAELTGVADSGFRVLTNSGPDGGQLVDHLHYHIIGGRKLGWPPG